MGESIINMSSNNDANVIDDDGIHDACGAL